MATKFFNTLGTATTLVGIIATAGVANAASLTQTANTNFASTNIINAPLSIQQFNSSLGTLTSVQITFTGDIAGDAAFENRSANPDTITVNLGSQLGLKLNNQSLFTLNPTNSYSYQVASYDGTRDFGGSSGKTLTGLTATQSNTQTFTNSQFLQSFIGTSNLSFLFSALANSVVTGSGNISSEVDTFARANLQVTYNYNEPQSVVEPSAVIGLGLFAGITVLSQRKKKLA